MERKGAENICLTSVTCIALKLSMIQEKKYYSLKRIKTCPGYDITIYDYNVKKRSFRSGVRYITWPWKCYEELSVKFCFHAQTTRTGICWGKRHYISECKEIFSI